MDFGISDLLVSGKRPYHIRRMQREKKHALKRKEIF